MSYPITHVVVQNTPPPSHVVTIGYLYPVGQQQEEVFRTVTVEEDEDDDETEVKVVTPRRGRRPKANEAAETK